LPKFIPALRCEKIQTHPLSKPQALPGLWMNLQLDYEFMRADREKGDAIR
jgi:hypothetical protein